ncbi:MAG: PAS domain-containing protein [Candidatus Electrothrix scaldis]|nr:MAG: PAS domain-containing protein [Candidatus Electrothrix sp. GW3-3]
MEESKRNTEDLLAEIHFLKGKLAELEAVQQDKQRIEKELQRSNEILNMLINNIPSQVFWKNRALIYTGCNKAFAGIVGMNTPAEVIGKSDYDLARDATHANSYREWDKRIMDSGEPVLDLEESYHNSDGSEGTVLTSKVPLQDHKGNVYGILGICTDISERKKIELENETLIDELTKAISEVRTLEGLLPICSNCKKIRDDQGYWNQIEHFIAEHSDAEFSHSICQDCALKLYPELVDERGNFLRP